MFRRLASVVAIVVLIGAIPPVTRAATATTITLDPIPATALPLQYLYVYAHVTPADATGYVLFELWDGTNWSSFAPAYLGSGTFGAQYQATIGSFQMRAEFQPNTADWTGSVSDAQSIVVARQQSSITSITARTFDLRKDALPNAPALLYASFANIAPQGSSPGQLVFEEKVGDAWNKLGQLSPPAGSTAAWIQLADGLAEGTHTIRATYTGDATSIGSDLTQDVIVGKGDAQIIVPTSFQVQAHHDFGILVQATADYDGTYPTGTLELREGANMLVSSSTGGIYGPVINADLQPRPTGVYTFSAAYSGDSRFKPATSSTFTVTVVADTVDATVSKLSLATFYPYPDGYEDTTKVSGMRTEPVAVSIAVKGPTGKTVRTSSIAQDYGAYSWTWNGRSTARTLVPAGTYSIVTTLKDAAGTAKVVKQSVVVSAKKLAWSTKDLYLTGVQTVRKTGSWGAYQFAMPSGVAYRSMRLYVYGSATMTFNPSGFGAHDTRVCSWASISPGCTSDTTGGFAYFKAWESIGLNPVYNRHGRYVRAYAWAGSGGSAKVYKLRLHFSWAVLK